ncbi:hypothetical protein E4K67_04765 [Desulfosporosinus fructosivorans]|uniref:Uncharacterized protein n=1 Tax=Desulfosporosinus fructosivorans TaxID=2018669 RepID=A0A4Z0R8N5_9FIRM|nr:hypothetical protein [Desulfosporosinus fructosivorans]TGE38794.1 hypothetical protein E4K67_04765 [Desulfosporosinus fructosivorans]
MEKEYVTARLFKNHRAADGLNTEEELSDCDQQQSTETQINLGANSDTGASDSTQNIPSLPQRLLDVIHQVLELLNHKK